MHASLCQVLVRRPKLVVNPRSKAVGFGGVNALRVGNLGWASDPGISYSLVRSVCCVHLACPTESDWKNVHLIVDYYRTHGAPSPVRVYIPTFCLHPRTRTIVSVRCERLIGMYVGYMCADGIQNGEFDSFSR